MDFSYLIDYRSVKIITDIYCEQPVIIFDDNRPAKAPVQGWGPERHRDIGMNTSYDKFWW